MKNLHLRGICLAAVLLLVTAGVVLAQGDMGLDKSCWECLPNEYADVPGELIPDQYMLWIDGWNWEPNQDLALWLFHPNWFRFFDGAWEGGDWIMANENGDFYDWLALFCEPFVIEFEARVQQDGFGPEDFGSIDVCLGQEVEWMPEDPLPEGAVCASVIFADDCLAWEFVPEPGTIALLGSGLVGLAGYATLRWRSRK